LGFSSRSNIYSYIYIEGGCYSRGFVCTSSIACNINGDGGCNRCGFCCRSSIITNINYEGGYIVVVLVVEAVSLAIFMVKVVVIVVI